MVSCWRRTVNQNLKANALFIAAGHVTLRAVSKTLKNHVKPKTMLGNVALALRFESMENSLSYACRKAPHFFLDNSVKLRYTVFMMKITPELIREINYRLMEGYTIAEIAAACGVDISLVRSIASGLFGYECEE